MALHELWTGGDHRQNPDYAMWPANAFVDGVNSRTGVAQHLMGCHYGLSRILDFTTKDGGDQALQDYVRKNPIVTGDVLNIAVTPKHHSLLELHYDVEVAGTTGLTWSLDHDGAHVTADLTPIAGDAQSDALITVPEVGTWPLYLTDHQVLSLTFDNVPAGGLGDFRLRVTPILRRYKLGEY